MAWNDPAVARAFRDNNGRFPGNMDYWVQQIPFVGSLFKMRDTANYWEDYRKNTGFSPRYPGKTYGSSDFGGLVSTSKSYGKMIEKAFR